MVIKVSYRMVHFTKPNKYIGMAWNYDHAILYATPPVDDYSTARSNLDKLADASHTQLAYFDGEYTCAGESEQLVPIG